MGRGSLQTPDSKLSDSDDLDRQSCWLCERPLGEVIEWHLPVPKKNGGKIKVPMHPICHATIVATFTNSELGRKYSDVTALREHDAIAKFVDWVSTKPADFDAPVKRVR